jgi:phosphatidylinositol glycan class N
MSGGALMVAIGASYLIFEKKVLSKSKLAGDSAAPADNALSRSLIGIQVRYRKICR